MSHLDALPRLVLVKDNAKRKGRWRHGSRPVAGSSQGDRVPPGRRLHEAPLRPNGRAHRRGLASCRRPRRHGQPRDGGPVRLEEARPDVALARRCRPPGTGSAAPGASTTATTRVCTGASTRPRCAPSAPGVPAISSTSASAWCSSTPRWPLTVPPRSPTSWPPGSGLHLSDAEFVELAAWVALENFRSRFNAGLGLRSQGFSDNCDSPVPAAGADAVA